MTKSLCVIFLFIALIIFSGCSKQELNYTITESDGIKTFRNKNIPSTKDLVIQPKELFTIACEDISSTDSTRVIKNFGHFDVDSKNNIYILDGGVNSVK